MPRYEHQKKAVKGEQVVWVDSNYPDVLTQQRKEQYNEGCLLCVKLCLNTSPICCLQKCLEKQFGLAGGKVRQKWAWKLTKGNLMLSLQILFCAEFCILQTFRTHPQNCFTVPTIFFSCHCIFFPSFLCVVPPFISVFP